MGEPGAHRDRLYCTGQDHSHFPRPRDDIIGRRTTVREDLVSEWQRRPVPMEESAYNSRIAPLRSAHWDDVVDQKCEAHPQVIPHPSDGLDIVATLPGRAEVQTKTSPGIASSRKGAPSGSAAVPGAIRCCTTATAFDPIAPATRANARSTCASVARTAVRICSLLVPGGSDVALGPCVEPTVRDDVASRLGLATSWNLAARRSQSTVTISCGPSRRRTNLTRSQPPPSKRRSAPAISKATRWIPLGRLWRAR